ncbi:hypothetical protein HK407_02g03750 [Ordospora pajunii]|uniref:uncharacterized protein n=1 Tax=Ordospora pajunii TaxID=3039483 RepID=UPI00295271C4|nr:uncharacterized protein HK407_02g03750 [Ordospora pajunii]KAH9411930.1 hypothetical protein HK407_02g03750 [Ordospora pajunii]
MAFKNKKKNKTTAAAQPQLGNDASTSYQQPVIGTPLPAYQEMIKNLVDVAHSSDASFCSLLLDYIKEHGIEKVNELLDYIEKMKEYINSKLLDIDLLFNDLCDAHNSYFNTTNTAMQQKKREYAMRKVLAEFILDDSFFNVNELLDCIKDEDVKKMAKNVYAKLYKDVKSMTEKLNDAYDEQNHVITQLAEFDAVLFDYLENNNPKEISISIMKMNNKEASKMAMGTYMRKVKKV